MELFNRATVKLSARVAVLRSCGRVDPFYVTPPAYGEETVLTRTMFW
jgi:hypothetical protein